MNESERGLSDERKAYLEQRITESFYGLFGYHLGEQGRTIEEVQEILEETRSKLSRSSPDVYPDGASSEDVLVHLFSRISGFSSREEIFGFALLWGERFGAGEFDPQARLVNLTNNAKVR